MTPPTAPLPAAPLPAAARRPVGKRVPPAPPRLEVVAAGERSPRARRRVLMALSVVAASAIFFGLAALHVLLAEGQFHLQKLQSQAGDAQAQYVRLRLEVAQLQSPERIVADAQERLGMVPPSALTYLAPTAPAPVVAARPAVPPKALAATAHTPRPDTTTQSWAAAKPALASHP